ncbi:MAG: SDR family oxidoreductase [Arthrobacter sp.]
MDLGIQGKTAFVAASTGGLGLAVASALAGEGANLVITGRRGGEARRIAAELPAAAIGVEADLSTNGGLTAAVTAANARFGSVDILVLNGPGPDPGTAASLNGADMSSAFDLLLRPQHALVSSFLPGMRDRRWGRILAIGSSGVAAPLPNLALSNIGRAALAGYLKTLASEVASEDVTVNMLLPGRIATERTHGLDRAAARRRGVAIEVIEAESRASIPARRYGSTEEFGATAAFLCSGLASYITGTALRCDGGLVRSL